MKREENLASVAKTATTFKTEGEVLSHNMLAGKFPESNILGTPGHTGVVVRQYSQASGKTEVVATARHGDWVPLQFNSQGKVEFGGIHTEVHIEHLLGREIPGKHVAESILQAVSSGSIPPYRALTMGVEAEAWHHDAGGSVTPVLRGDQLELQQGLLENPRPVQDTMANTPKAVMFDRAAHILKRSGPKGRYPDDLVLDTGVPLVGDWHDEGLAINDGSYKEYVHAAATKLEQVLSAEDPSATSLANNVANGDFAGMTREIGHMGAWVVAAAHVSIGTPHVVTPTGEVVVPLDIAIAHADVFNSELSTIAEMLMAGAPLMMGKKAIALGTDGREHWVRDARAIFRHTLETTYAGPFIMTPEEYRDRIANQITSGQANTADRAAYIANVHGKNRPVMHGALRVRLAAAKQADPVDTKTWVGRIEYTGRSSSPSLLDEAASNALLYLMTVGAYEAVAAGKHPTEYFAGKYPSLTRWESRQELVQNYNMYGANDPKVKMVISEALDFLTEMGDKYPNSNPIQQMVTLAQARIKNLLTPEDQTPRTLQAYKQDPSGAISVVMQHMYEDGYSALEIAKEVHEYQLSLAEQFVRYKGDGVAVLGLTTQSTRR